MIQNSLELCEFEAGFYNSSSCVLYPAEFAMVLKLLMEVHVALSEIGKKLQQNCKEQRIHFFLLP
jgi:hypothetical protein